MNFTTDPLFELPSDPPCPECDAPLIVSGQECECEECGYVDEPDYEAIAEAKAEREEDDQ